MKNHDLSLPFPPSYSDICFEQKIFMFFSYKPLFEYNYIMYILCTCWSLQCIIDANVSNISINNIFPWFNIINSIIIIPRFTYIGNKFSCKWLLNDILKRISWLFCVCMQAIITCKYFFSYLEWHIKWAFVKIKSF